jgi:small subunit ribosomal protein S1
MTANSTTAEAPVEAAAAPSPMEKLLTEHLVDIPSVGDVVQGVVLSASPTQALIDLGPLGIGIVLGKEMRDGMQKDSKLRVGMTVSATLVSFDTEDGSIELSVREASYERSWEDIEAKLKNREIVETRVTEANKGGLMVEVNGIPGFLPVSQLASEHYPRVEDGDKNKILELLKKLVGEELKVRILDADRETEKLIASEKAAQSEKERELINTLAVGEIIEGEISGVVDFGAFVKFYPKAAEGDKPQTEKLEGLVPGN